MGQAAAPFTALLPMTPRIPSVRNQIRNALYLSRCFRCYWRVSFVLLLLLFFFFLLFLVLKMDDRAQWLSVCPASAKAVFTKPL